MKVKCPYWGTPTGCPFSGNYVCGDSPCAVPADREFAEFAKKIWGDDYVAQ